MQPSEKPTDAFPLDSTQQQRIFDAVLRGPITELIEEVVRRSLTPRKRKENEAEYATRTARCLNAIKFDIPLDDQSAKTDLRCRPTWDDCRRLATIGNAARITTGRALHHAVRIGHHLFRTVMSEIMTTSEQTGASVRDLLVTASTGNGLCPPCEIDRSENADRSRPDAGAAAVVLSGATDAGLDADRPSGGSEPQTPPMANSSDHFSTALSIPPQPMAKRAAPPASREKVTEERIEELEDRIDRLQETMQVLIDSIDELRVELVHTLRNLPDRLPPPLHIHSLPLDPTASDFGDRVNAIPQEVMDRLRAEAADARRGEPAAAATAAEGNPVPAAVVDESEGNGHRCPGRQGRLFG